MKRGMRMYTGILTPATKASKRVINSAVDLSYAIKNGFLVGYYDARYRFHRISREDDSRKVIKNAASITLLAPGGTILGPLYLAYKGSVYLIKRNRERTKESLLEK